MAPRTETAKRRNLAADPTTDGEQLRKLARQGVAREVAGNPNCPTDLLLRLAPRHFEAFSQNPVLPLLLLEDPGFCLKIPTASLRRLLRREDLPATFIHTLVRHRDPEVRASARFHIHGQAPEEAGGTPAEEFVASLGAMKSPVKSLAELFDLGVIPEWIAEPLAGARQGDIRELVMRRLEASADPSAQTLGALYRRAGAGEPKPGEPVVVDLHLSPEEMTRLARGGPWARGLAARHPRTPPGELGRLARDSDLKVSTSALGHPHVPEEALWFGANSALVQQRRAVAANPSTPEALLDRLAQDTDEKVRGRALAHPAVGVAALRRFASDPSPAVRIKVARNRQTPPEVLATLAAAVEETVRRAVARNPGTPAAAVKLLARDAAKRVRDVVAARPDLADEERVTLLCDPNGHVRHVAAFNRRHPHRLVLRLMNLTGNPDEVRQVLAEYPLPPYVRRPPPSRKVRPFHFPLPIRRVREHSEPNSHQNASIALKHTTTPDELDRLAKSECRWTLEAVAGNESTRPETLAALLHHPARTWRLYYQIARNPNTPRAVLDNLAARSEIRLLRNLIWNKALPLDLLQRFAAHPEPAVRSTVAVVDRLPIENILQLAADADPKVARAALMNRALPWSFLETKLRECPDDAELRGIAARRRDLPAEWRGRLARDPDSEVRLDMTRNEALTAEDFDTLSTDPDPAIRHAVLDNAYRWPDEIFARRALSDDPAAHRAVAGHPRCPVRVLERLATHPDAALRALVARHAATPDEVLRALAEDTDAGVRAALLAHPRCPPSLPEKIIHEGLPKGADLYHLLACPAIEERHYQQLFDSGDEQVRQTLASHEKTPVFILRQLVHTMKKYSYYSITQQRALPADFLEELIAHESGAIRHNAAVSFFTPREVAERIALSGTLEDFMERRTRAVLARKRDASAEFLLALYERELKMRVRHTRWRSGAIYEDDYHVMAILVARPEIPVTRLEPLLEWTDLITRRAVLARPDLPPEWRERMLAAALARNVKRSGFGRLAALAHPLTPARELERFARQGRWVERCAVIRNPAVPRTALEVLARDANVVVRALAAERLLGSAAASAQ